MSDAALLYHAATRQTGPELGDALDSRGDWWYGEDATDIPDDVEVVCRWGSRERYHPANGVTVLNDRGAMRQASNNRQALEVLRDAGINVPRTWTDNQRREVSKPALGRRDSATGGGSDIKLILQDRDMYLTNNDWYSEYIPTELEYRVHVAFGEVLKVYEKRLQTDEPNNPYIRNTENGIVFLNPRNPVPDMVKEEAVAAVDALGLHFGSVDVIGAESDFRPDDGNSVYVLEVNTAPTLDEPNIERFAAAIQEATE